MAAMEKLIQAIRDYDVDGSKDWAVKALAEGTDPVKALEGVSGVMKEVGDLFGSGELWLPDLIGAADAAMAGLAVIEEAVLKSGKQAKRLGTVVIGTVFGDIHSIGKTMVAALLTANGFKVVDVGTNVSHDQFVQAIKDNNANILAMSAILTTTAPEQLKVIEALKKAGLRDKVKIMVGGAAITTEFAKSIGADGYRATAPEAVELAKDFVAA